MFITTNARHRAATLALVATIGLTAFKLFVGALSGSVGVLSEGVHSFLDLISASISYFTVRHAVKPADEDHPFGHGKIETISSLFEALLLIVAALLITIEGIDHFRNPAPITHEWLAIGTILISLVLSYFVYRHNLSAARATDSSALHVNALHFLADVIASAGVLVGLVLLKLTGLTWIDPLMAFGVALYILLISFSQVKRALMELSDAQLPDAEIQVIRDVLDSFQGQVIGAHDLRTRKSGITRHIDFHLVVCGDMTVDQSHQVCDQMETQLTGAFPTASVNIHVEPCEVERVKCESHCPIKDQCGKLEKIRRSK